MLNLAGLAVECIVFIEADAKLVQMFHASGLAESRKTVRLWVEIEPTQCDKALEGGA